MATMGSVRIHDVKIFTNTFQFTFFTPSAKPTPTTAPTLACVVEMGIPRRVAIRTTRVAEKFTQKAFGGVTGVIFDPIVCMTWIPYVPRPTVIMAPATTKTQMGVSLFFCQRAFKGRERSTKGADGIRNIVRAMG